MSAPQICQNKINNILSAQGLQFFGPLQERQCYQTSFFHVAYTCIYTFLLPILTARRAALVPESSTNYWQVFR